MWRLLNQAGRNQQIAKAQEDTLLLQEAQLGYQGLATIQTKHSLLWLTKVLQTKQESLRSTVE